MHYITIAKKQSNSGSIHDIASDMYDIVIKLNSDHNYIVIAPSFYNMVPTRHKTPHQASIAASKLYNQRYEGVTILDRHGEEVFLNLD